MALTEKVGVEVLGVDADRLRSDDDLADWCLEALTERGVVLFRELNTDDRTQVDFSRKLGSLNDFESSPPYEVKEVMDQFRPVQSQCGIPQRQRLLACGWSSRRFLPEGCRVERPRDRGKGR